MRVRKGSELLLSLLVLIPILSVTPALGSIIWDQEILVQGQGLGQDNILSFSTTGTESGCVKWSGSGNVYNSPCPGEVAGDPYTWTNTDTSKSRTFTLAELGANYGITSADTLGVVFNPAEPGGNSITLNVLVWTFYSSDGTVSESFVWTAGPATYCCNNTGTGGAGQVFRLDSDSAQLVQQTWFTGAGFGNNRIGVSAAVTDAAGSLERFYPFQVNALPTPVPEPASFLTMGSGLLALGLLLRRYAKKS